MAIAIAIAPETAGEAAEQEYDQDNDEYRSKRHGALPEGPRASPKTLAQPGSKHIPGRESLVDPPKLTPSFRGDAKHRTMVRTCAPENLEIPRCAIAHLRSGANAPSRNDGDNNSQKKNARSAARLCQSRKINPEKKAALLRRLLVHGARCRRRSADRLDRTFDRAPQPGDLRRRPAFRVIFAGAFALAQRHQQIGAIGDLAAPYRRAEFRQCFTRDGN